MTGILAMVSATNPSTLNGTMTVGSTTFSGKATTYYDGYISSGSFSGTLSGAIGGLAPTSVKGATVRALSWTSSTSHSVGGQSSIEVSGNRSAGFISSVTVNGVSVGTIGSPSYNAGPNTTTFNLGASNSNNPFGTSGTKSIVVS
ncbi:MAG: hypothetical protein K2Q27_01165 [Novosphingobium sp.]|nr:hypothetical protein [Novosphingobium sp.]